MVQLLFNSSAWVWEDGLPRGMVWRTLTVSGAVLRWSRLLMNNSAWDWEAGVRRDGLKYTYKVGCFGAMGGAGYRLTTRLGFRRLDFRGMVWSMLTVSDAAL